MSQLNDMSLKENLDICLDRKYDCAILNLWYSSNYGALLTCFALQQALKKYYKSVKVVNYIAPVMLDIFKNSEAEKFAHKYLNLTRLCLNKNDLNTLNNETENFIVGSDQIWRNWGGYLDNSIFMLSFVDSSKKKIAYAASFGIDHYEGSKIDIDLKSLLLERFDDISVREDDGVSICKNTFNVKATHVLDPVFIVDKSEYDAILTNSTDSHKNFVASYILDKNEISKKFIDKFKILYPEKSLVNMTDISPLNKEKDSSQTSVESWLYNIKNCDYLLTDSFHGACFAIIYNKQFICLANEDRGYSRFRSIFKQLHLESRCVLPSNSVDIEKLVQEKIDYNAVNKTLANLKEFSLKWLQESIEKEKTLKDNDWAYEHLKNRIIFKLKIKHKIYKMLSKCTSGTLRLKLKRKRELLKNQIDMFLR